jgi:hypothetical protein
MELMENHCPTNLGDSHLRDDCHLTSVSSTLPSAEHKRLVQQRKISSEVKRIEGEVRKMPSEAMKMSSTGEKNRLKSLKKPKKETIGLEEEVRI